MRRRDMMAAAAALPALAVLPVPSSAEDGVFADLWRALVEVNARIEASPQETEADQDAIDALCDEAGDIEDRILQTPGQTRAAAEAKVRTLIGYMGRDDHHMVAPLRDVLAFVVRES